MMYVRVKHPSKIIKCRYCGYVVSSSLNYQMKRHVELRHSAQIKAKTEKANEITILATPCLELGDDEQLNDYEPTNNYEHTNKDEPLNKTTKKQQKAKPEGFTKAKTKNSRTETVSVPPKTP